MTSDVASKISDDSLRFLYDGATRLTTSVMHRCDHDDRSADPTSGVARKSISGRVWE